MKGVSKGMSFFISLIFLLGSDDVGSRASLMFPEWYVYGACSEYEEAMGLQYDGRTSTIGIFQLSNVEAGSVKV